MKAKQAEQKAARGKVPYKSVEDLEKAIADLDRQVESGKLKLVDERKALADISALRKQKKTFGSLETMQAEIDEDKAKIAELKKTTSDPEAKALSDRYTEIAAELDKYRAEQDEVYKNLSSLRDEKTQLQNLEREKYQAKKALEDQFYSAKSAYRNYERAAAEARREKFKAEREAKDREWKKQVARQKMEEAETPAYSSEILTCEGLIGHFDPTSPEALAGKNKGSLLEDKGLKATDIRVVDNEIKGTKLLKKDDREEDYFKGTGGKGKKGKKGGNKGAAATDAGTPTEQDKGKFQLNHGVLIELGKVDVAPPSGWDDVTKVLENLREKLSWYKENSERVTKEVRLEPFYPYRLCRLLIRVKS